MIKINDFGMGIVISDNDVRVNINFVSSRGTTVSFLGKNIRPMLVEKTDPTYYIFERLYNEMKATYIGADDSSVITIQDDALQRAQKRTLLIAKTNEGLEFTFNNPTDILNEIFISNSSIKQTKEIKVPTFIFILNLEMYEKQYQIKQSNNNSEKVKVLQPMKR